MSLDLWLTVDTGGTEPATIDGFEWNYTHNVNPMWRRLFDDQSLGQFLEGKKVWQTEDALRRAVIQMALHMDTFRELNPPNGWGDADTAFEALLRVLEAAVKHPNASWGVSR